MTGEVKGNKHHGFKLRFFFRMVLAMYVSVFAATGLASQDNLSPPDSDALFARAVQDYTQNRLTAARAEFEKVQGDHAQEAKQYITKIAAYIEAMDIATTVMRRSSDEIDASSLEYAIQKFEEALRIKPDGPWNPAQALEQAKTLHTQIVKQGSKAVEARDRNLCAKALGAAQEHRYKEAELFSCPLANDNPSYSCGGDEAVHMCQQMRELTQLGGSSVESQPSPHPSAGSSASAMEKGKAAFEKNDFEKARNLFTHAAAEFKSEAGEYLDKISRYQDFIAQAERFSRTAAYDEARVAFTNAANVKPDGPGNPRAQALLMELQQGIDQFYSGDYVSSMHNLEGYARDSTERQPLAHFYLGASKLARFFITGSEDASLQQDALHDLKIAKQSGYKANGQDVSPKILKAYDDLSF